MIKNQYTKHSVLKQRGQMFDFLKSLYTVSKTKITTHDLTKDVLLNIIRINPKTNALDIAVISSCVPKLNDLILIKTRKNTVTRYKLIYVEELNSSKCSVGKFSWKAQAVFHPRKVK
jgi:hypothetical protein